MHDGRTTIHRFIIEEQRRYPGATGELTSLLADLISAFKAIGVAVARGALAARGRNDDREVRSELAANAAEIVLRACEWGGHLAAIASTAASAAQPHVIPACYPRGKYLLAFEPLEGAANLDVNAPAGTVFSILRHTTATDATPDTPNTPNGAASEAASSDPRGPSPDPTLSDFLQAGTAQVGAGYALYGPATVVVLTLGRGVHAFTLDTALGEFVLTHPDLRIPAATRDLAVSRADERAFTPPLRRYLSECRDGAAGPRNADFTMRWLASVVAEVHRLLVRGGLLIVPGGPVNGTVAAGPGAPLPILCQASPLAMIVEQAGGAASTGRARLLDLVPTALEQRVPALLGATEEVERLARYHREYDDGIEPFYDPLFNTRSLFRAS